MWGTLRRSIMAVQRPVKATVIGSSPIGAAMSTVFLIGEISRGGTLPWNDVLTNVARFQHYERELQKLGWNVVHEAVVRGTEAERRTWEQAMRRSIARMVQCDYVYLLPGWQRSRGARLEVFIAGEIGIPILDTPL